MNFFGFMDETGILTNDSKQPYFALGLLRLNDTGKLLQDIMAIKAKHKGILAAQSKNGDKIPMINELKFNSISSNKYVPMYKEIIQACFDYPYFYFCIIQRFFLLFKESINFIFTDFFLF